MEDCFAGLSLSNEEEEELLLAEASSASNRIKYEFCLVGRFLMDKIVNFKAMRNRMAWLWQPGRGI